MICLDNRTVKLEFAYELAEVMIVIPTEVLYLLDTSTAFTTFGTSICNAMRGEEV
jgi:hypothetical protein